MDITTVSSFISSIDAAFKMIESILGVTKETGAQNKMIELRNMIMSLQSQAFSMNVQYSKLLNAKNELEKEIVKYQEWQKTKEKYELKCVSEGTFVYCSKSSGNLQEPDHWLCTNCYKDKKESILQRAVNPATPAIYICPECKSGIRITS
jgi:hypothetical protein